jgi:hypothetical protein
MSKDEKTTSLATAALLLSGLLLGGYATSTAGSSLMDARATAVQKQSVYPEVQDLPPKREACDDGRRTGEAPEGTDRRARSPDVAG